jgi:2-C-methyl-D-erythritol 4-phosphate cytidylyltransferase
VESHPRPVSRDAVAVVPISPGLKLDLTVAGRPTLHWTLSALAAVGRLVEIVVTADSTVSVDGIPAISPSTGVPVRHLLLEPGAGRLDAIRAALAAATAAPRALIHEADRPLTTPRGVEAVLSAADGLPAAVAAVPARNTLKRVVDGRVLGTAPRERLHQVLTPSVFDRALLEDALRRGQEEGWGCAHELELAARAGISTRLVPGDPLNVPISTPESVPFADLILARTWARTGERP